MTKKAFITGVTGQDGSYLAELLLDKGYEVHGLRRPSSIENTKNINQILDVNKNNNFFLHYGDITDSTNLHKILSLVAPDEIYNLAAQSHVRISFDIPEYTHNVNAVGCLKLMEAIKNLSLKSKIYQASTSELYGNTNEEYQNEETILTPVSPYAISKLYSFNLINYYREQGFFASNGILFNHESPRRGDGFVTKKIIKSAKKIQEGSKEILKLGNIYAERDWGYAKEYVECMWMMLNAEKPDNFVISTGKSYSVKYFIELVFNKLNIPIIWEGEGLKEKAINKKNNKTVIEIDPYYFRKIELNKLRGDYSKAKKILNWEPKTTLEDLVDIMINETDKSQ